MHVFVVGDEDWIVAADMADAIAVCAENFGELWWSEFDEDSPENLIRQLPDDEQKTICVGEDGQIADGSTPNPGKLRLTCGEWAKREQRGLLCSLNWYMTKDETIQRLMELVLKAANDAESNAGYGGRYDDGGASILRTQVEYYRLGMSGQIPAEWQRNYGHQLDPEYAEWLRLSEKFGRHGR